MKYLFLSVFLIFFHTHISANIKLDSISKKNSICLNNGSIRVYATSNSQIFYSIESGPITFSSQSSNIFNGLGPGLYKVKIVNLLNEKDSLNIFISTTYIINDFIPIILNTTCKYKSDGIVIGNRTIGTGIKPFTWTLINNNTNISVIKSNDTFKNLPKGDYTLTMTDSCLNTTVHNFEVKNINTGFLSLSSYTRELSCNSTEIKTSFQTIEPYFPVLIKYRYKTLTVIKVPDSQFKPNIIDTLNIPFKVGETIMVTLYNNCGDSIVTNIYLYNNSSICTEYIGCDTLKVSIGTNYLFSKIKIVKSPSTYIYSNLNTDFVDSILLPNFNDGDSFVYTIYNKCNDSFIYTKKMTEFSNLYGKSLFSEQVSKCEEKRYYSYYNPLCDIARDPIQYQFIDIASGNVLEDKTISNRSAIILKNFPINKWYKMKIMDGCGRIYLDSFLWTEIVQIINPKVLKNKIYNKVCLDSTVTVSFTFNGFYNSYPELLDFRGPKSISNTKIKYNYLDINNYTFFKNNNVHEVSNLGVGKYYFSVTDSCLIYSDSFEVYADEVSNNYYSYKPIKHCQDNNKLILNLNSKYKTGFNSPTCNGWYSIFNFQTNKYVNDVNYNHFSYNSANNYNVSDTFKYLQEGKYQLRLNYRIYNTTIVSDVYNTLTQTKLCTEIIDTLIIPPYTRPDISVVVKIVCNNNTYVQLIPDSSFGIFPYKYEINQGPQTYPVQKSNIFQINQKENYRARIWDTCGNANTMVFSIDTIKFQPIKINDTSCATDYTVLRGESSPFFSYKWIKPDGSIAYGDSLVLKPVLLSDLGKYNIVKYVNFMGCRDSFFNTYYLNKNKILEKWVTIKDGDSTLFVNKFLFKEGKYVQRIPKVPCDSFYILNVNVIDSYIYVQIYDTICEGGKFIYRSKTYIDSGRYYDTVDIFAKPDSVYVINIIKIPTIKIIYPSVSYCDYFIDKYGVKHDTSFFDTISIKYKKGCDSLIHFYPIIITKPNIKRIKITGCKLVIYKNKIYFDSKLGVDSIRIKSQVTGCDSILECTDIVIFNLPVASITTSKPTPMVINDTFTIVGHGGSKYYWSFDTSQSQSISVVLNDPKFYTYRLIVIDSNGCVDSLWFTIKGKLPPCNDYGIPNAFTPNGDNNNDIFIPNMCPDVSIKVMTLYNRWGEKMWEVYDNKGWDGYYKGNPAPMAVYIYYIEFNTPKGVKIHYGSFALVK